MTDIPTSFVCGCCGQTFENWPPDVSFQRPDDIWILSPKEREKRAWESSDLCALDDRHFYIRGVLYVPLRDHDDKWGIGLWAQVSQDDFEHYMRIFDEDGLNEAPFDGVIANQVNAFGGLRGETVQIRMGNATQRPTFVAVPAGGISSSQIAMAQMNGVGDKELHEIIDLAMQKR
jgi:hypothetical protein